jgi:hypothetical protein
MTFDQRWTATKPYVTGFVLGLIAAPIIAFSAGWVSTTSARATAVEDARVETLAGICSSSVGKLAASGNTDLSTLKGYDNRDKREAIVATAMADIQVPADLAKKIAAGCSRTLS